MDLVPRDAACDDFGYVREYASIKKSPNPPREILLDYDRAKAFIDENAKRDEDKEE